jgi:intracellular multiplication protein IcmK
MRIFFFILIVFMTVNQVAFAASDDAAKTGSDEKMDQLRDILVRASRSNVEFTSDIDLTTSPPASSQQNNSSDSSSAAGVLASPFAGLIGSPAAMPRTDAASSSSSPPKEASNKPASTPPPTSSKTASVDSSEENKQPDLYDEAFGNVVNQMLPMSPEQISKLREVFTESQLAAATPPGIPPKPTSTSLIVNLSPQAVPPVIRLGAGYITSLVFVDATGQPWPIAAYSVGDPQSFNIQWDRKGNTMLVQSSTFYKRSNLAVILRDLNTPVMIDLVAGQKAVDYRVDLRIPGLGPNAVYVQNGIPGSANPLLLDVLNGIPPKGSKELRVAGGNGQAWLLDNKLYLRTTLNVISPGWQAVMNSIDGTHAYQMQPAPIVLALQNGRDKVLTLTLEEKEKKVWR